MKRILSILVLISMVVFAIGCSTDVAEEPVGNGQEPVKVALILVGPINDGGWNAMAYNGLVRIEENYENVEISYAESVPKSDYEDMFRLYAEQEYDLIIGHGFEFSDVGAKVASQYPDVSFAVVNGSSVDDNLASVTLDDEQVGFIAGALAGMLTESNKIAGIGGLVIPPIELVVKGYVAGAEYVNPDVEVFTTFTGSFEDANKAKEVTISMIENGVDVVMTDADQSSLGSIEATKESGTLYVGVNADMNEASPNTVVNTAIVDGGVMFTYIYDRYLEGTLGASSYLVGINEGAVYLGDWHGFEDEISDEIKNDLQDIIGGLASHDIDYPSLVGAVELE